MASKKKEKGNGKDEFALVNRHHLEPQLFQVAAREHLPAGRNPESVKIEHDLGDGGSITIRAWEHLQPFDLTLMCLVCCKAAQEERLYLLPDTQSQEGLELREGLKLREDSVKETCLVMRSSARSIMQDLGLPWAGHKSIRKLSESLDRMFGVGFRLVRRDKRTGRMRTDMFHMLSATRIESVGRDAKMTIALNPVLAATILDPGHYAHVGMDDLRKLAGKDAQQLLYVLLSNAIPAGGKRCYARADIRVMVYGADGDAKRPALSNRTARALRALHDMADTVGWVVADEDGRILISRPGSRTAAQDCAHENVPAG